MYKNVNKFILSLLFMVSIIFFGNLSIAAPEPPGDSEILTNVFRNPTGSGPKLLSDKVLQITPAIKSQNGSIWSKEKIDLSRDFEIAAYLYLGDSYEKAADGITFTLQNDSRMDTTRETSVLGDAGMGLGAYANKSGGQYIRNALSVEFDTYYNNGSSNRMDREIGENGKKGHVAVVTPKSNNNNYSGEHSAIILAPEFLSNGTWRKVSIRWQASSQILSYDLDGIGSNNYKIPNVITQFGSNQVYWGFTASTGSFVAENLIAITALPQKISQDATIKNMTTEQGPDLKVTAVEGDQVKLESIITTSSFVNPKDYDSSIMEIAIPNGVSPDFKTMKIDNEYVDENRITFENDTLKITDVNLSSTGKTIFSVEANVVGDIDDVTLSADFTLVDIKSNIISKSNQVFLEIPKIQKGKLVIKSVDIEGNLLKEETLTGKIGDKFDVEPKSIDGYQLEEVIGELKGEFEENDQVIIFRYVKQPLNLKQTVKKSNGSDADIASIQDRLFYTVELESLFKDEGVLYEKVIINSQLPKYLTNISNLKLETKNKKVVGTVTFDEESNSIIANLSEADQIDRNENIILSYQAQIKSDTIENTKINVKANADVIYNNEFKSGLVYSNEVSTTVEGGLYLLSGPKIINFGEISYKASLETVDDGKYDQDLIVADNRLNKTAWILSARLVSQMTLATNYDVELVDSLQYKNEAGTVILNSYTQPIYEVDSNVDENKSIVNISDSWGTTRDSNGVKLVVDPSKSIISSGKYEGEIEWQLMEGFPK